MLTKDVCLFVHFDSLLDCPIVCILVRALVSSLTWLRIRLFVCVCLCCNAGGYVMASSYIVCKTWHSGFHMAISKLQIKSKCIGFQETHCFWICVFLLLLAQKLLEVSHNIFDEAMEINL